MPSSEFLQSAFEPYLKRKDFDFIYHNKFLFKRESDIIACKNFEMYEYEFKTGESDFRKDIKKNRHDCEFNTPNYFYYVVSDLSIINGEYLDYAGIYVHSYDKDNFNRFKLIKEPKKIRQSLITSEECYLLLKKIFNGKKVY